MRLLNLIQYNSGAIDYLFRAFFYFNTFEIRKKNEQVIYNRDTRVRLCFYEILSEKTQ